MIALGTVSCLGFNVWSGVPPLNMDFLSFFDFLTNSVMMPLSAAAICILVLKVTGIQKIEDEICISSKFRRRKVFRFVLRYLSIALLAVILVSSVCDAFGLIRI